MPEFENLVKRLRENAEFLTVSDRQKAPPNVRIKNLFAETMHDAADAIEKMRQRWIPATERLPENYGEYLVTVEGVDPPGRYVTIWTYLAWCGKWADGDDDFVVNPDEDGAVTHWMKIPEPPKEDSDGE